jgi:hypothetical protein
VAEWLRNGLQNRVLRFNSGRGLQPLPGNDFGDLRAPGAPIGLFEFEYADVVELPLVFGFGIVANDEAD